MSDPSGWDLVAAAQAGDRAAFGQLYARYVEGVSGYVGRRVLDRHLAQDLTGETFARALRRIDSVSDQGRDVGAWFTTIARNLLADHWKSHRTQRETTVATIPDTGTSGPNPEQAVITRETAAEVRAHVARLLPDQRECLRLRFWEGMSGPETAAVMGRTVNAVKALQHRGVEALRAELTDPPQAPAAREATDPLARARQAVTEVARRVAAQRQTTEQAQAQQLACWRTNDTTTQRGHDRDARALAEGGA